MRLCAPLACFCRSLLGGAKPRFCRLTGVAALIFMFTAGPASADPLEQVLRSRDFRGHKDRTTNRNLKSEKWFTPGGALWNLFNDPGAGEQIFSWLEPRLENYLFSQGKVLRKIEFRGIQVTLTSPELQRLELRVMIPHPKFEVAAETGLVPEFGAWKFPQIQYGKKKDLDIPGAASAVLYELSDGSCGVVVEAELGSLITLLTPRCDKKAELERTVRGLNFEAFAAKLKS